MSRRVAGISTKRAKAAKGDIDWRALVENLKRDPAALELVAQLMEKLAAGSPTRRH